jgi:hypothetical protein
MYSRHLQCAAALDSPSPSLARCQLLAGHYGPHAVMFARHGRRLVRCWRGKDPATIDDHLAAEETMPWVRGCPTPAWWEYPQSELGTPVERRLLTYRVRMPGGR